tara:strand:+ start:149 stop:655 length:507 start_codon:yes stop_codon:yes gene_type:complete
MSLRERVADAYLRQCSEITFKETTGFEWGEPTTLIEAYSIGGKEVGQFEATVYLLDLESISEYYCADEMLQLIEANPSLLNSKGEVYVVEVVYSKLSKDFWGRRCGLEGYLRLARHTLNSRTNGKPFLFIPNYCNPSDNATTSGHARRVWKSLSRVYQSNDMVILFDR